MNTLYYGDNLNILRRNGGNTRGSKCVPVPQASTAAAAGDTLPTGRVSAFCDNVLFKDESGLEADSQIMAFEDTWHWKGAASTYDDLILEGDKVSEMLQSFRSFIGENQMMAYLVMMAVRLKELHRVLKPLTKF